VYFLKFIHKCYQPTTVVYYSNSLVAGSLFGLIDLNLSDFFSLCSDDRNCGHNYKLFLSSCSSNARRNFFTFTGQQSCGMTYQLTVLTFPVSTVLNVLLIQKF